MGIEGNEAADLLADEGALHGRVIGPQASPTISGIRSIYRELRAEARLQWWDKASTKLSTWSRRMFGRWPQRPLAPPETQMEAVAYLQTLEPLEFAELLRVTEFYFKHYTW
ncbi:uncharacterized protein PGRI_005050 [Penicillium griseofulvum]|uniref:RNase H type-1 domain-containing protein n=1 Tax=Penicillium patulum TaxID=5078 RepID=A0A135LWZ1_PENPA|nr:uncharacterized protein PGRI_005050 [Penicillium griseofulvum]KXG53455.1 hypothetical protein PGRI_005050 [Penicillium griseofulvum]